MIGCAVWFQRVQLSHRGPRVVCSMPEPCGGLRPCQRRTIGTNLDAQPELELRSDYQFNDLVDQNIVLPAPAEDDDRIHVTRCRGTGQCLRTTESQSGRRHTVTKMPG